MFHVAGETLNRTLKASMVHVAVRLSESALPDVGRACSLPCKGALL
jgi:hypothetical protein